MHLSFSSQGFSPFFGGAVVGAFHPVSPLDKVALNPQPLPPFPNPGVAAGIIAVL
jgi:hypothetical protein